MSKKYDDILASQRQRVKDFIVQCATESRTNEKDPRRPQNNKNWMFFHGNLDWSHKGKNDAKIHLHKLGVAAERTRAKFKSSLMNYDKWITVEPEYEDPNAIIPTTVAKRILMRQLEACDAKTVISDAILCGCMESRMALKVGGKYVTKPRYVAKSGKLVKEEKKFWRLDLSLLGFENYLVDTMSHIDPLFEIEEFRLDYYKVLDLASEEQSPEKPLRLEAVKNMNAFKEREQEEAQKTASGNTMKQDRMEFRKPVLIQNFFGTILADTGEIFEWENEDGSKIELRNIFCVLGNEAELLLDPQRIKRWSSKAPYVTVDPLRSPNGGRKAIMDAGVDLNWASNELFSLMLDGAIRAVHNTTWYREDWLSDKRSISGGIEPGAAIPIDASAPPGAIPIGVVKTGDVPQEAFVMHSTLERLFAENVISNMIDLSGNMPGKQVRATELVQASGAINDVFDSLASDIEDVFIEKLANEAFLEIIQHADDIDEDFFRNCFGDAQDLADKFLEMSPQERFAAVDGRYKFVGKGLRGFVSNQAKAQALINFMNTLTANPITFQAIESQVSVSKISKIVAKGLGIDIEDIQPDEREQQLIEQKQMIRESALAQEGVSGAQSGGPSQAQGSQPAIPQPGPDQGM